MGYNLNNIELYLFNEGSSAYAYKALGCHRVRKGKQEDYRFAVWAPNAQQVSVVGDFNGWDASSDPMKALGGTGVWETHIQNAQEGMPYKYAILTQSGETVLKADPYAFRSELRPGTASLVWDLAYQWSDSAWQLKQKEYSPYDKPISIYEVHLGSWHGEKNYREIADELKDYVIDLGYTHVEIMPIAEHPLDASWGYQVTGYYAATARFGTPQDFMYLVDTLHQAGIGVLLDWVPAHFPRDAQGLRRFDGSACYEHENPLEGEQPQWGTMLFNYGRTEVVSFLMSNAVFWLDMYHIDGLRVDAVSCMLYRDYGKEKGQWVPNRFGKRENLEAIAFLSKVSELVFRDFPGTLFIAEEATSYPNVTKPTYENGLGFNYKWNMGWMNDMLEYMSMDSILRKWHHNKLTFSMFYAFSENFILPLSHDEVVHGKKSLLDKMPGDYWQKFANLRVFLGFMFAHPGKKLIFMGGEIGQFIEWRFYEPIEWKLLGYEKHRQVQDYMRVLNRFYTSNPALYEVDDSWEGFEWLNADDAIHSVIAFARRAKTLPEQGGEVLLCAFNFTPSAWENYRIGVPLPGNYIEVLNSDEERFGGSGLVNTQAVRSESIVWNGRDDSIAVRLPPLGAVYFKWSPFAQSAGAMAKTLPAENLEKTPQHIAKAVQIVSAQGRVNFSATALQSNGLNDEVNPK